MKTTVVEFEPVCGSTTNNNVEPRPVAKRRTSGLLLMNLGRNQCRYAVDEDPDVTGGHFFCGAATLADRPYCEHHHRIVTNVEIRRAGTAPVFRLKRAA